jgi:hypothetical protein
MDRKDVEMTKANAGQHSPHAILMLLMQATRLHIHVSEREIPPQYAGTDKLMLYLGAVMSAGLTSWT